MKTIHGRRHAERFCCGEIVIQTLFQRGIEQAVLAELWSGTAIASVEAAPSVRYDLSRLGRFRTDERRMDPRLMPELASY